MVFNPDPIDVKVTPGPGNTDYFPIQPGKSDTWSRPCYSTQEYTVRVAKGEEVPKSLEVTTQLFQYETTFEFDGNTKALSQLSRLYVWNKSTKPVACRLLAWPSTIQAGGFESWERHVMSPLTITCGEVARDLHMGRADTHLIFTGTALKTREELEEQERGAANDARSGSHTPSNEHILSPGNDERVLEPRLDVTNPSSMTG